MGLQEKRIISDVTETGIPKWQSAIKDKTGLDIKLEIDWTTFGDSFSEAKSLRTDADRRIFKIVAHNLEKVCADKIGKQAVTENIKAVRFCNRKEADDGTYALAAGVLTVSLCFAEGVLPTDYAVQKGIESTLG